MVDCPIFLSSFQEKSDTSIVEGNVSSVSTTIDVSAWSFKLGRRHAQIKATTRHPRQIRGIGTTKEIPGAT